jgi:hypothetical protein
MRRVGTIAVTVGLVLGGAVAGRALTLRVAFPDVATLVKVKVTGVVDEAGNVLFGSTPGKVAVTSLPAGPQNVNVVGGTIQTSTSTAANSFALQGATFGQQTFPVGGTLNASLVTMSSRNRILITLRGSLTNLPIEIFPNQSVVLPLPERLGVNEIDTDCTDTSGNCDFFTIALIGSFA